MLRPEWGYGPTESDRAPMARAIWNGKVIAEAVSDRTVEWEGSIYFPESSLRREYFRPSSTSSTDPAKGQARYMTIVIDGQDNQDAACTTPIPSLWRAGSKAMWPSGGAWKWKSEKAASSL